MDFHSLDEEVEAVFPHLSIVRYINQTTTGFERELLRCSSEYQDSIQKVKQESSEQMSVFQRLFAALNNKIETGLLQLQNNASESIQEKEQEQEKCQQIKAISEEKNEEQNKQEEKKQEERNEEAVTEEQKNKNKHRRVSTNKLLRKKRIDTEQSTPDIYFCIKCFLINKDQGLARLSFIFATKEEYIDHVLKEHQILPFFYLPKTELKSFSHAIFKETMIDLMYPKAKVLIRILFLIREKRYSQLYICGCKNVPKGKTGKTFQTKFFISLNQEDYYRHLCTIHQQKNQAFSTHFLTKSNGFNKIQKFLDIPDKFYESTEQILKIIETLQFTIKRYYHSFYFYRLNQLIIKTLRRNSDISSIELIAKAPNKIRVDAIKQVFAAYQCLLCREKHSNIQKLKEHYRKNHRISNHTVESLNEMPFSPQLIQEFLDMDFEVIGEYKKQSISQKIVRMKLNISSKLFANALVFKCGFCEGDKGYFTNHSDYLFHLEAAHETMSEDNSHFLNLNVKVDVQDEDQ